MLMIELKDFIQPDQYQSDPLLDWANINVEKIGPSLQFEKKSHANILYNSKSWLPKGVYVDKEYTPDVEYQRKLL